MPKDYYAVLGVEKSAGSEQIKKAYREKAKEAHPDVNKEPEAEAIFQRLSEAYVVLSDPNKRSAYDASNEAPVFSRNEVAEILRKREKRNGRAFQAWLNGESTNHYPPTNYKANELSAIKTNKFIVLVVIIFLIDLSYSRKPETVVVTNLIQLHLRTRNVNDIGGSIVFAQGIEFARQADQIQLAIGDTLQIQKSLFFRKLNSVKTASDQEFYNLGTRDFTMGLALFVLFFALLGVTPMLSPERKFNAAIIAGFFAFILISTLLFS